MLSEKEKEAIKELIEIKELSEEDLKFDDYEVTAILDKTDLKSLIIVLNLIEKQSKEIEELKSRNQGKTEALEEWINGERVSIHCIHKDKIKAKIEEFKKVRDTILENEKELNRPMMTYDLKRNDYCEKMLQSLLEDNTEDNTEEIKETNLRYLICESDFKNMNIVKLLNEFFEENNLIVNKLVRAVNKIGRNKQC